MRVLKNLFRRPPIRMGSIDNREIETTRLRNAQFVSFLGGCDIRSSDRYDNQLRRRKWLKRLTLLGAGAGVTWVVVESARALPMF